MRTNVFREIPHLNAREDPRRQRRALDGEEVDRLLAVAQGGADFRGISGPDRAILYRLAIETGLRASELGSLTAGSFDVADPGRASVTVEAAYTKNGETADQPLRPEMAEVVREYLHNRPRNAHLWDLPRRTADMLRSDLQAARATWIGEAPSVEERERRQGGDFLAARDGSGRVVDFHALRHTFCTRLARSGVAPAVAMKLARHSSMELTMRFYTHLRISDERAALDRLPPIGGKGGAGRLKATGTDQGRP